MDSILQDLRYALRSLSRTPGFVAAAALALALGIGGSTAVFSVLDAVVLRPLPLPEPSRLVRIYETTPKHDDNPWAPGNYLFFAEHQRAFGSVTAYLRMHANLRTDEGPLNVTTGLVAQSFFHTIGAPVQLGRDFEPAEESEAGAHAAILSDAFWRRQFGGERKVLGKTIQLDGETFTIVGVARPGLSFPGLGGVEVYRTIGFRPGDREDYGSHMYRLIARIKPGITLEAAAGDALRVTALLAAHAPKFQEGWSAHTLELLETVAGPVRPALLLLLGAVVLVLLVACANVAGMLLARGAARSRELSIRAALGSSRGRLLRLLLTESLLLALLGGGLGVLFAAWGVDGLVAAAPAGMERLGEVSLDARVLAFALAVSLAAGLLAGLAPALQWSRAELHDALKETTTSATGSASKRRARAALVVGEIALALLLVLGAALLLRSFQRVLDARLGFEPQGVVTGQLALTAPKYARKEAQHRFARDLLDRVSHAPGVEAAALTSFLPMDGVNWTSTVRVEGEPEQQPGQGHGAPPNLVTPDYFRVMRIPLLRGRLISPQDGEGAPPVAVIDEAFARRFFPGQDPLGRRFALSISEETVWRTVVGVVADVRSEGLDQDPTAQVYLPYAQLSWPWPTLVARTGARDPLAILPALRRELAAVDADQPLAKPRTLEQVLAGSLATRRFQMTLVGVFAAVALALAAIGIYGVMSFSVAQRTREIGVRLALGAQRGEVLRMVVGQGLRLAALGVAIGLAVALLGSRLLAQLLYGVSPTDPITYASVAAILAAGAALACWLPARRATRVDPAIALRSE